MLRWSGHWIFRATRRLSGLYIQVRPWTTSGRAIRSPGLARMRAPWRSQTALFAQITWHPTRGQDWQLRSSARSPLTYSATERELALQGFGLLKAFAQASRGGRPKDSGKQYPTPASYGEAIQTRIYANPKRVAQLTHVAPSVIARWLGISERVMYARNSAYGLSMAAIRDRAL